MNYYMKDLYPSYVGLLTDGDSKVDEEDQSALERESNGDAAEKTNVQQTPTKNILIALVIIILMVIFLGIGG